MVSMFQTKTAPDSHREPREPREPRELREPGLTAFPLFACLVYFAACLGWTSARAVEPGPDILLWPNGAPGSEGKTNLETVVRITAAGDHVLSNIHKPSITPYLPMASTPGSASMAGLASGCAVIVAPGGGHRELWSDHEGHNVARWLSDHGIAAFVLKYRLAKETNSTYTVDDHAVADMQRALRLVRSRAAEWHIATNRIGVVGFSAGGEVAFLACQGVGLKEMAGDPVTPVSPNNGQQVLPAFQALIYPGRSQRIEPATNSPPVFLVCGYNDRADISEGLASVYLKFKQLKVPAELHIYAGSGHGFGFRPQSTSNSQPSTGTSKWLERFEEWLADSGFLKKQ
jgi:acetyl esterase/lipase